MPKKKSAKKASERFLVRLSEIQDFLDDFLTKKHSDKHISWAYDLAIIRIYREFEILVLECLVCAINNDTEQLSAKKVSTFPNT